MEKRLAKDSEHAKVYQTQAEDMIHRGVARKLSSKELEEYSGPVHYISHHEVLKPESKSTPVRIVFNSSANCMGHTLNDYWAKGPDLLNNLLGGPCTLQGKRSCDDGRHKEDVLLGEHWNCRATHTTLPVARHRHQQTAGHVHHPNRIVRGQTSGNHRHHCFKKDSRVKSTNVPRSS